MKIRNFLHKGLRRLYEDDNAKGVPTASSDKLKKQLAFIEAMKEAEELRALPLWSAHELTGGRKRTWSLSVTRNWRLTFWVDPNEPEVCDVNLEDYH
jgi:toxin HigB-1